MPVSVSSSSRRLFLSLFVSGVYSVFPFLGDVDCLSSWMQQHVQSLCPMNKDRLLPCSQFSIATPSLLSRVLSLPSPDPI
jgi:hypothetical protein